MGKIVEEKKIEKEKTNNVSKRSGKKGIEELLVELRTKNGLSRIELVYKLNDIKVTEKDIKKWEIGLSYPDLDTIYKLSEIYRIPSTEFVKAKNNSYENGLAGINKRIIRWFVYTLNVSFYIATILTIIFYATALIFALWFFVSIASQVKGS